MELSNTVINGEALEVLKTLPSNHAHMIVTSPPYWGLRDYGKSDQLGLEENPDDFVRRLTDIFSEAKRVLREDGTLWLNIGDSYKDKNLVGIPWKVAFSLQSDGWYLRQDIIWSKPNPMPESASDRCTKSHEHMFLLSKSPHYYFDSHAIRDETSNKRDVWTVAAGNYKGAHFATFPQDLIIPCIQAGTSQEGCCSNCGSPNYRMLEMTEEYKRIKGQGWKDKDDFQDTGMRGVKGLPSIKDKYKTIGWEKNCKCDVDMSPCIVMDIFMGSGTTAYVAKRLGRKYLGIELNEEYVEIANNRLTQEELFI